ncbi:CPBP family intramembrane metalloprotease [Mycolicibacterium sp. CH28]|uniref:CPBP family glutamic-type intramembrane protease n=1 Tax=Mycolicibacterium sp. CH28 TaxID=2512237 RepID=UPI0010818280|nr:CPBP family glutamic-type intramembrane protease [Mycolicibacterium sp. CH28]TGD84935.1 CPBP family intramembrane metalloprotease [Mycolicibacterium sp. CH28]
MLHMLRARPLMWFFLLSYAITWLLWAPLVLTGVPAFSATTHTPSLGALPAVAIGVTGTAFAMTALTQGRPGVMRMLRRLMWWRVGLGWYAVAVLLIPLGQILITAALVSPDALRALSPSALALYPASYLAHFIFGPLFEESGWRGFALPRLQHRYGPLRGSLLLGLLWSGWHFFLYMPSWLRAGPVDALISAAIFVVFTVSITVLFTWLSNNTAASLLLAILLHGSIDGTATYVQRLADRGVISTDAAAFSAQFGVLIVSVLVAGVLLVWTRGRLSYPRYRAGAESLDLPGRMQT